MVKIERDGGFLCRAYLLLIVDQIDKSIYVGMDNFRMNALTNVTSKNKF